MVNDSILLLIQGELCDVVGDSLDPVNMAAGGALLLLAATVASYLHSITS